MIHKKCSFCNTITTADMDDLYEKNWNAFKLGDGKTEFGCPEHNKDLTELMIKTLDKRNDVISEVSE